MKKRKAYFIVSGIILLAGLMIGMIYHFESRTLYELNIPDSELLENITLKRNSDNKHIINSKNDIQNILNVLNGNARTTKKESIQDIPVLTDEIIVINFNSIEKKTSTVYAYKKNGNYFIEQPYNGIYKISEDEYHVIINYTQ